MACVYGGVAVPNYPPSQPQERGIGPHRLGTNGCGKKERGSPMVGDDPPLQGLDQVPGT